MTNLALIPARGNSKRIPGKNILPFFGHPMIAYAIAAAKNTGLFSDIIVSTDDPLTGRIAEWYGATYLPRPAELSGGSVPTQDVALHVLDMLEARGKLPECLCQLMVNCPLRRSEDIMDLQRTFTERERDFQISAVPYRGVYPHWALGCDGEGRGRWLFSEGTMAPSQELQSACCPTGAVWWTRVEAFRRQKVFYGEPFHMAPMDADRGIDIDTPEDLDLAETIVRGLEVRDGSSPLEPVDRNPFSRDHA
ncbi:MAG: acylneuraminate cytidylyltransferase family protein [Candidatus Peribacteraceae bacterium]|jgi:CMP-N-acetylneuraminic acid synthetase